MPNWRRPANGPERARLLVADQGPDLVKGIEHFQQRHANTAAVSDVAHYGANVLENRWERDPRWADMLKRFSATNQQIRQTADAFLLSPTLRNKARFMNVGPLLRFAPSAADPVETGHPQ